MQRGKRPKGPWEPLRKLIHAADVIIEVVDARDIEGTRLPLLERWSGTARLLILANKTDLIPKPPAVPEKSRIVWISARDRSERARNRIIGSILSRTKNRPARAILVGYPNVGKSTLVNTLSGRKAAKVSPVAGTTKDVQWINISGELTITDYRGVFPKKEPVGDLLRKGAMNAGEGEEGYAYRFAEKILGKPALRSWLEKKYDVSLDDAVSGEDLLAALAKRRGWFLKGGEPDSGQAARHLLRAMMEAPEI